MKLRPTYAGVTSTLALVIALSGGAYAATQLPKNSVGTRQLQKNAVTTAKIKSNAVKGPKIKDGSIGTADLADGGVENGDLAAGSVTPDKLEPTFANDLDAALDAGQQNGSPIIVDSSSGSIQTVNNAGVTLGSVTAPETGYYAVMVTIRAFSQTSATARIFCSFGTSGGIMDQLTNTAVPAQVTQLPMLGYTFATSGQSLGLTCNTGSGSPDITASYRISAFRVQLP
ncbi:hypothetical protein [Nocardioides acrostichi]|uniref:Uncharacterized protein n=1 Tax=Nocardioides acrostichi TaxID=2784339 RepID=A0A930Y6H4_9ACTN|nr:hypothetical protein [Nocardioides acrostichi]MBF4160987.1 hypothetical protein [Nocardioides acrostichi]